MCFQILRSVALALLLSGMLACGGQTEKSATLNSKDSGGLIYFSQTSGHTGREDPANWCFSKYKESVVLNADRINLNKRYFFLTSGTHRVLIEDGSRKQSFIIRPTRKGRIELFTSANLPMCLANKSHFTLAPDGNEFSFDNGRTVRFGFTAEVEQGAFKCSIEFPPGITYGLTVNPCVECPDL